MPYRILEHTLVKQRAIKCLRMVKDKECGAISYHPDHVERKHCPVCNYFHPEPSGEVVPVWEDKTIKPNISFIYEK
jgi:hypothetical protein